VIPGGVRMPEGTRERHQRELVHHHQLARVVRHLTQGG
jgi:hypothetical protein